MKRSTIEKIREEFKNCILKTVERCEEKPKKDHKPFHERLLGRDILKASLFERSFSTSFGQRTIEIVSKICALENRGTTEVVRQKKTVVQLDEKTITAIHRHLQLLREGKFERRPCWELDIEEIKRPFNKLKNEHHIVSDLWFIREGVNYFFSIKTVKPNIDQTQKAKEDMLKLKAFDINYQTYFALPYNPFGNNKKKYNHNPPSKIFDMLNDKVVLIGKEYWDLLGGRGTYEQILEIAESVGVETKRLVKI